MKVFSNALMVLALLVLIGCSGGDKEMVAMEEERIPWAEFAATTVDEYYRNNPEAGVDAGVHQYDGLAAEVSVAAIMCRIGAYT